LLCSALTCTNGQDANQQKVDIGPCPKVHSDTILKQFKEALEQVPRDPRIGIYKQEHENHIYGFVDDCDRRIKMAQRKLEKTPEENRKTVDLVSGYLDGIKTVVLSGFL
jgi:RNA-binding protein Luc7-like 2